MKNEKKIRVLLVLMMLFMSAFIAYKTLDVGRVFGWGTRQTYVITIGVEIFYLAIYVWQSRVLLRKLRTIWSAGK